MSKYVMSPTKASVDIGPGTLAGQFHKIDINDGGKNAFCLEEMEAFALNQPNHDLKNNKGSVTSCSNIHWKTRRSKIGKILAKFYKNSC
jgi:hypothetical protein